MDTRTAILDAFCFCMANNPTRTVSVGTICERAGVSKKTYYNHFDSRQALIEAVLERDFFLPQRQLRATLSPAMLRSSISLLLQHTYETFGRNRGFYQKLIEDMGEASFVAVFTNLSRSLSFEIYTPSQGLDEEGEMELDYMCTFLASTSAQSLMWWAKRGFEPSASKMAELQRHWSFKYLETGDTPFPAICEETARNSAPRQYP